MLKQYSISYHNVRAATELLDNKGNSGITPSNTNGLFRIIASIQDQVLYLQEAAHENAQRHRQLFLSR
jgi:hypothetical protein